ncbi:50S ribosomal protein L2 [Candidatus Micrarchaeota archaeon]|nr:50S ribosomal protein L2 [Candidatus Micrarchaeota archaeon]
MGKPLKHQRRGKGSPKYLAPKSRFKVDLNYRNYDDIEKTGVLRGKVVDFVDDPGRDSLLMKIKYDNDEDGYLLAPEGIAVGDIIEIGVQAKVLNGSVLPLYRIPDGAPIFNLERSPGDGGKMVKTPGSYATLISKEEDQVYIKLPSRRTVKLSNECRAQVGVISGGGRKEKPLMKAGASFYKRKARNRRWPIVRGVAASAYNHPHGGKQHHEGRPTTVKRGDPPGKKVGHVAARSTGRKKGRG